MGKDLNLLLVAKTRRYNRSLLAETRRLKAEEQCRADAAWLEWRRAHQPFDPIECLSWKRKASLEAEAARIEAERDRRP